jgi:hypothetical protein
LFLSDDKSNCRARSQQPSYAAVIVRVLLAFLTIIPTLFAQDSEPKVRIRVSWEVESTRLEKRVDPVCPTMARTGRAEKVLLAIEVDPEGAVRKAEAFAGEPLLAQEAMYAIKKWRFRPYILAGQPVTVETQASVDVCTDTDAADRKLGAGFVKQFRACEKSVEQEKWDAAEAQCSQSLQLARDLPTYFYVERAMALRVLGHVRLMSKRPAEAKDLLTESLQLLEEHERTDGYDVGQTLLLLGMSEHALGNVADAERGYLEATDIFERKLQAVNRMNKTGIFKRVREDYQKRLALIYTLHAQLLEDSGNKAGAAVLRQKEAANR